MYIKSIAWPVGQSDNWKFVRYTGLQEIQALVSEDVDSSGVCCAQTSFWSWVCHTSISEVHFGDECGGEGKPCLSHLLKVPGRIKFVFPLQVLQLLALHINLNKMKLILFLCQVWKCSEWRGAIWFFCRCCREAKASGLLWFIAEERWITVLVILKYGCCERKVYLVCHSHQLLRRDSADLSV